VRGRPRSQAVAQHDTVDVAEDCPRAAAAHVHPVRLHVCLRDDRRPGGGARRSFCRFDMLSFCRFDMLSFCRFDMLSFCRFDMLSFCRFDMLSFCRFDDFRNRGRLVWDFG
jgi:hypothetical protein